MSLPVCLLTERLSPCPADISHIQSITPPAGFQQGRTKSECGEFDARGGADGDAATGGQTDAVDVGAGLDGGGSRGAADGNIATVGFWKESMGERGMGSKPEGRSTKIRWTCGLTIANEAGVPPPRHQRDPQRARESLMRPRTWVEELSRPRHSRMT